MNSDLPHPGILRRSDATGPIHESPPNPANGVLGSFASDSAPLDDRGPTPETRPSPGEPPEPRHLSTTIEAMLRSIEQIQRGQSGSSGDDDVETWEDEETFYLEVELPSPSKAVIDVSIQSGRIFFRIEK